ncbi:hypothetical protein GOBAR_DD23055 [Gossypium barbadense]|nr:hypothetical protein GOBAR_DD23055 [Gossypium barbadense]
MPGLAKRAPKLMSAHSRSSTGVYGLPPHPVSNGGETTVASNLAISVPSVAPFSAYAESAFIKRVLGTPSRTIMMVGTSHAAQPQPVLCNMPTVSFSLGLCSFFVMVFGFILKNCRLSDAFAIILFIGTPVFMPLLRVSTTAGSFYGIRHPSFVELRIHLSQAREAWFSMCQELQNFWSLTKKRLQMALQKSYKGATTARRLEGRLAAYDSFDPALRNSIVGAVQAVAKGGLVFYAMNPSREEWPSFKAMMRDKVLSPPGTSQVEGSLVKGYEALLEDDIGS